MSGYQIPGGTSTITIGTTTITGGADTQVLFNDAGTVGSDAGLTYAKTTDTLTLSSILELPTSTAFPGAVTDRGRIYWNSGTGLTLYSKGSVSDLYFASSSGSARIEAATSGGAITLTGNTGAAKGVIINGGTATGNILEVQDNGTPVLTAADGGLITAANFVRISGGELALNADYTNLTAVMSNTALSATLVSGRTYSFTACLFFANSPAADGCLIDFAGGSVTVTNFRAHAHAANAVGAALAFTTANSTALATDIDVTLALTTQALMMIQGTIVPSADGTFVVRASEKVDGGGTLTIFRGSWLNIRDAAPL